MRSEAPLRMQLLPWLTVLRYPAALWVVLVHSLGPQVAAGNTGRLWDQLVNLFMERGYLSVSFFFMLSGFILAHNYPAISSTGDYLRARCARVLPVYYLALAFALPLAVGDFIKYGSSLVPITACVLTLSQSWIPTMSSFWNGPAWSLSCEAFFYISFPLLLVLLTRWWPLTPSRMVWFLAGCFLAGLVLPTLFVLKYGGNPYTNGVVFGPEGDTMQLMKLYIERFPLFRVLDFVSGMALCVGLSAHLPRLARYSGWLVALGLLWIVSSFFIPFIYSMGTYCLPGFALLIVGAAALPFPHAKTSGTVAATAGAFGLLLGNASYAVYLVHAPLMSYLIGWDQRWWHLLPEGSDSRAWAVFLSATVLTTALSILIYRLYEEPARRWLRRK